MPEETLSLKTKVPGPTIVGKIDIPDSSTRPKNKSVMKCEYCERETERLTRDHIIPVSKGGGKIGASNIVKVCLRCNSMKGNLLPHYFLYFIDVAIEGKGIRNCEHAKRFYRYFTFGELHKVKENLTTILKNKEMYEVEKQLNFKIPVIRPNRISSKDKRGNPENKLVTDFNKKSVYNPIFNQ